MGISSCHSSSLLLPAVLLLLKKSNLGRIEQDLARARAAILKAVQLKNFTSEKLETFVPKGSIYRNVYAFY
ncbi:hypothetical protein PTKIN_Ptkin19aG0039900 [Pterospermum kingtungense]